jgi:hypothetical protein
MRLGIDPSLVGELGRSEPGDELQWTVVVTSTGRRWLLGSLLDAFP